jgi:hypothetical protein
VKVIPSNQTLILAGEQVSQGPKPGTDGGQGLNTAASGGAMLRRVTMMTALPDSTLVYVRADYAPAADAARGSVVATQPKSIASSAQAGSVEGGAFGAASNGALVTLPRSAQSGPTGISDTSRDVHGNPQSISGHGALSSYLRPEEQYAQTQRLLAAAPPALHLDVHA